VGSNWTTPAIFITPSVSVAPQPAFLCPDEEDVIVIKTSLVLDGGLPFKAGRKTAWTKIQRIAAGNAKVAESLEDLPEMVCLVHHFHTISILNCYLA
jgi:hypothetical protein